MTRHLKIKKILEIISLFIFFIDLDFIFSQNTNIKNFTNFDQVHNFALKDNDEKNKKFNFVNILNKNEIYLNDFNIEESQIYSLNKIEIIFLIISNTISMNKITQKAFILKDKLNETLNLDVNITILENLFNLNEKLFMITEEKFIQKNIEFINNNKTFLNNNVNVNENNNKNDEFKIFLKEDELNYLRKIIKLKTFLKKMIKYEKLKLEHFNIENFNKENYGFNFLNEREKFMYKIKFNMKLRRFKRKVYCYLNNYSYLFCIRKGKTKKLFNFLNLIILSLMIIPIYFIKKIIIILYKKIYQRNNFLL